MHIGGFPYTGIPVPPSLNQRQVRPLDCYTFPLNYVHAHLMTNSYFTYVEQWNIYIKLESLSFCKVWEIGTNFAAAYFVPRSPTRSSRSSFKWRDRRTRLCALSARADTQKYTRFSTRTGNSMHLRYSTYRIYTVRSTQAGMRTQRSRGEICAISLTGLVSIVNMEGKIYIYSTYV